MGYIRCNTDNGGGDKAAVYLGEGSSFNLQSLGIADYASLTVDNFVCEISTTGSTITNPNPYGDSWVSVAYNYTQVTKSYDASTGVLTLTGGNINARSHPQGQTNSANCTISVYLIRY